MLHVQCCLCSVLSLLPWAFCFLPLAVCLSHVVVLLSPMGSRQRCSRMVQRRLVADSVPEVHWKLVFKAAVVTQCLARAAKI